MPAITLARTENGVVKGYPSADQMNAVFKGIPYAAPPVGPLRWRAPQPAPDWDGVYDAVRFARPCYQTLVPKNDPVEDFFCIRMDQSEDCLYLNVYTPAQDAEERLPVAVYFHGGGMQNGYSYMNAYDGDGFAKRGILYVSVGYRLNLFGFFADPKLREEDPNGSTGCYGTLDQAFALRWIQRNIAGFGGDPDNVSIFGQSGGGRSVQTLAASPVGTGLFRRAIMQSGGGLSTGSQRSAVTLDEGFAVCGMLKRLFGAKSVAEMREIPGEKLIRLYGAFLREKISDQPHFTMRYMGPKIDGYVLPAERSDLFRGGRYQDVQYMVGATDSEFLDQAGKTPSMEEVRRMAKADYGDAAESFLRLIQESSREELEQYFRNQEGETLKANALGWCELQMKLRRRPSYAYLFELIPPGSDAARHSSEHHYVFQTLMRTRRPYTGRDYDLSNELADRWAGFFRSGDPNDEKYRCRWTPYTREKPEVFLIRYDSRMGPMPESKFMTFIKSYSLGGLGKERQP